MKPGERIFQGKAAKGDEILIRYPQSSDLEDMTDYINTLSQERTYIRFQGEVQSVEDEKKYLEKKLEQIKNRRSVQLMVYAGNTLVGNSNIDLEEGIRKHVGVFGISLAKEFRNRGIGKILMEKVIEESKKNLPDLKIITLTIFGTNKVAFKMYQKFGFREYGRLPKGAMHKGKFIDYIYMSKTV